MSQINILELGSHISLDKPYSSDYYVSKVCTGGTPEYYDQFHPSDIALSSGLMPTLISYIDVAILGIGFNYTAEFPYLDNLPDGLQVDYITKEVSVFTKSLRGVMRTFKPKLTILLGSTLAKETALNTQYPLFSAYKAYQRNLFKTYSQIYHERMFIELALGTAVKSETVIEQIDMLINCIPDALPNNYKIIELR